MVQKKQRAPRRKESLSRECIIDAAIDLLDSGGEAALTFRVLAERLATGAGSIYWHIANKNDLLIAACDTIIAKVAAACMDGDTPETTIRTFSLGMFDAMEAHPWIGSTLTRASGQMPFVRIVECLGRQIEAMGVPREEQWPIVATLMNFILGIGGQNASNSQFAIEQSLDRSKFMGEVSAQWGQLDSSEFSFVSAIANRFSQHDDREDFLIGINLIISGIRQR